VAFRLASAGFPCVGRPSSRLTLAVLLSAVALAGPLAALTKTARTWPPPTLRDTGLYSDWATKTVAPGNLPFSPQYPLWSDGAVKSRWMYIPNGRFIDGSNPDVWRFPVGTRLWKEFRFERRAETRFIEHTPDGWQFASYAWTDDETEAPVAPELGVRNSVPIRDGVSHAIPSRQDCGACHLAGPSRALGVTLLQLSPDRDPAAPHAEQLPPGAVDVPQLVARGLIRRLPPAVLRANRIVAETPTSRAVLGYLSTNCGSCHTGGGELSSLAFALNYPLKPRGDLRPPALLTALGRPSHFRVTDAPEAVDRVSAGRPDASVVVLRMASRNPAIQMPPLGTRLVDEEALGLIRRWIAEDLVSPTPPVVGGRRN
jgi:hypothetical protein